MPEYILKTDDAGNVTLQNGRPVYRKVDGDKEEEIELDAGRLFAKIKELGDENQSRRQNQDQLKTKLDDLDKLFDDVDGDKSEWVANAKKALDLQTRLDKKELVEADKVAELEATIRREVESDYQQKLDQLKDKAKKLEDAVEQGNQRFNSQVLRAKFADSKFIAESCVNPRLARRVLEQDFAANFAVDDDGNVIAYHDDKHDRQILNDHTENATFDQALEALVKKHPDRDAILKGVGESGAGVHPNGDPGLNLDNPYLTGNLTKIAQIQRTNPARAKQLAEAAKAKKAGQSAA